MTSLGGFLLGAETPRKASLQISNQSDKLIRRVGKNPEYGQTSLEIHTHTSDDRARVEKGRETNIDYCYPRQHCTLRELLFVFGVTVTALSTRTQPARKEETPDGCAREPQSSSHFDPAYNRQHRADDGVANFIAVKVIYRRSQLIVFDKGAWLRKPGIICSILRR